MSTGKNIAILASCLHTGGAERVAGLLSKQLSKLYNVYLFLGDVQTIVYDYGGTIVALGDLEPLSASAILRNKRKFQIDVSISFVQYLNFLNIRTKQGERVIVSERSSISPMPFSDKLQINRYYPYADEIVACSYGVKEDLFTHGVEGNVQVIYNFIEKQIIVQKGKQELPNEVEEFLGGDDFFVHVGRLGVEKNQKRLIVQFAIFRETSKRNMKLLIVGSGPLHAELQQFVEEKALKKFVKIIPYDKNPFRYVAKAKAFLLSSHYEGLPNVLLEAMTLGCPIIASDCLAGPRELLKGEMDYVEPLQGIEVCDRGILVENRETEDDGRTHNMADAMERISKDFV